MFIMNINLSSASNKIKKQVFNFNSKSKHGFFNINFKTNNPKCQQDRIIQAIYSNSGTLLGLVNQSGQIFIVDFKTRKFWIVDLVMNYSQIGFSSYCESHLIVGKINGIIVVLNIHNSEIITDLKGHKHSVKGISCSNKNLCITSSTCEAIIWNLADFSKFRELRIEDDAILKIICFIPRSNHILACFQNDVINFWQLNSFELFKQVLPAAWNNISIKSIAVTRNGRAMVMGGYSRNLVVFVLDVWEITDTITLPDYIQGIKSLDFISQAFDEGNNRILTILSSNGCIYFYDMLQKFIMSKITIDIEIIKMSISHETTKQIACVLSNGKVHVYSVQPYIDLNKTEDVSSSKTGTPHKRLNLKKSRSSFELERRQSSLMKIQEEMKEILDISKLRGLLNEFWEYPERYRIKIWSSLLDLPNDAKQYNNIAQNTYLCPFHYIENEYPMENKKALKNLKKLLCTTVAWCPFFAQVSFLPIFVFPFMKVFDNDPVLYFEAIISIIVNWCQHWFEYYPLSPINILAMIENALLETDPSVYEYLAANKINSEIYAWPLLQSAFSEVLTTQQWLAFWDHTLTNEPAFLLLAVVAFNCVNRCLILSLQSADGFREFYRSPNCSDFKKLIQTTYSLLRTISPDHHPRRYLNSFKRMDNIYPRFVEFPKASIKYGQEMEFIKQTELDLLKHEREMVAKGFADLDKYRDLQKANEEILRIKELENIYKTNLAEEKENVKHKQMRLAELRNKLKLEEDELLSYAKNSVLHKMYYERQKRYEVLIDDLKKRRQTNDRRADQAKMALLNHYRTLLKHRQQIEKLIFQGGKDCTCLMDNFLLNEQNCLVDEFDKACASKNTTEHLKQLNIATGIAATDMLIKKVENELEKHQIPADAKASNEYNSKMIELAVETKELEKDIRALFELIGSSK